MLGLGCMRLSTAPTRDDDRSVAVIRAALDAGATLLDTADVYAHGEGDVGHNETLVARALRGWTGDRNTIRLATKGGLRRVGRRWTPDGRATHLRAACLASCRRLEVECIDLYQLHAVDPRTSFETSVRALAGLREDGLIRDVGLCNVTVSQIEAARAIVPIAAVQVSVSVIDAENLRNGVAEYCRDHGIRLIAYRPLGGERIAKIARDRVLGRIATRHDASPHEIALAWLLDLDPAVAPIPGATSIDSARSIARVLALALTDDDRAALDARFPGGRLLRVPRARRRPPDDADGDVVLVMGMPGAGKSTIARELVSRGYGRLNRDERGGRVADLVTALDEGLAQGRRRWVLDNTYPNRSARNEVIECAWRHGVPARCLWVDADIADAQINAITRLIRAHGRLPTPEELRERGREDPRYFGPDAQFRWVRQHEPPVADEGFASIERIPFERRESASATAKAIVFELDDVLCVSARGDAVALSPDDVAVPDGRAEVVAGLRAEGWHLLALAWRPQVAAGEVTDNEIRASFDRVRGRIGADLEIACCPHPPGPPVCWCRKPQPGLILEFAERRNVSLADSVYVGRAAADRTLAARLGMRYEEHDAFFG